MADAPDLGSGVPDVQVQVLSSALDQDHKNTVNSMNLRYFYAPFLLSYPLKNPRKGLVGKFDYPESDTFDIDVSVTLVRSYSKKLHVEPGHYNRFMDKATAFDYIEYGSDHTYDISFRVVRFPISDDTYECLVMNIPHEDFDIQKPDYIK